MNRIESIEITHHQLPLEPAFPASWDPRPRTRFPVTIVRVRDSDGRVGIGSGDAMYGFDDVAGIFLGTDPLDLDGHAARLDNVSFHVGRPWPLDVALWDLAGQIRGEPVWRMLGGTSPRLRLYASTAVHRSVAATVEVAQRLSAEGFDALKLRFGRASIDDDLATVAAVLDAVGDRLTVMVDCNQGWRMPWDTAPAWDIERASSIALRLQSMGVHWIEEPLHRGDYDGLAELGRRLRVHAGDGHRLLVAGGEMTREPYEFRELLDRGCLDVFQPDVVCTMGFGRLTELARRVVTAGRGFTPHTWGNGIGVLANLHLAAGAVGHEGTGWVEFPYDPPEWTLERRDYPLLQPIEHVPGSAGAWIELGSEPGLGIVLDEDRLARTASGSATFS